MAKEVAARYHDRSIWIVTSVGDEEYKSRDQAEQG